MGTSQDEVKSFTFSGTLSYPEWLLAHYVITTEDGRTTVKCRSDDVHIYLVLDDDSEKMKVELRFGKGYGFQWWEDAQPVW